MLRRTLIAALIMLLTLTASAAAAVAAPTNVHVTGQTRTSITIAWNGPTTKYAVWRDGAFITRLSAKTYTYTGLACETSHQLGVRSVSGNRTSVIIWISGQTAACPVTGGGSPPPAGGYFTARGVGSWSSLPTGSDCAGQVHRSTWEPRPDNTKRNHTLVDPAAVHASLSARHYTSDWANWNTWLLPRVDGQFTGTTDEIFQWAACKWGLPDNLLRGIAVRESTWYQYLTYPNGRPVSNYGSGDYLTTPTADTEVYCNAIDQLGGYSYQSIYGQSLCPKTFSITGIMSWENPSWGVMPDNQNGTFPFNRNSTAFAEDYIGAYLRGCYEGWIHWLGPSGDLMGCVGSWYSGDWHSSAADGYIGRVQNEITNLRWLQPEWPTDKPGCSATYGCPGPDPL